MAMSMRERVDSLENALKELAYRDENRREARRMNQQWGSLANKMGTFVEDNESIFEFFPELTGKHLVKIASALSTTAEEVAYLNKNRCYAMALGEETMDLVNFEQIAGLA